MSENEGGNSSKIVVALIINAVILALGFGVLLYVYLGGKKESEPQKTVSESVTESVSESVASVEEEPADPREDDYQKALAAVGDRDITKALRYFNTMLDYKDSQKYVANIGKYQDSFKLAEKLKFDEAAASLRTCDGLFDSNERAEDYDSFVTADKEILLGEFDKDKENAFYAGLKALTDDEARFLLCKSKAKAMCYLGSIDEKGEVGKIMADLAENRDWLASLSYGGEHRIYGEYKEGEAYYGAPDDPAYSCYVYGPMDDDSATFFWFYRDKEETDYFYSLIYGYLDQNGTKVYVTGYFEKDGTVKGWFKQ